MVVAIFFSFFKHIDSKHSDFKHLRFSSHFVGINTIEKSANAGDISFEQV